MILIAVVVLVFRGRRASWQAFRAGGRLAIATVALCVAAGAVTLIWQLAVQPASLESATATLGKASPSGIGFILGRAIGTYGWGEAAPPLILVQVWALMVAALVVLGVASAVMRRVRREIAALILACVLGVGAVAAFLAFGSHAGQVQGRWFIALLAGIPILAGWMTGSQPVTARFSRTSGLVGSALVPVSAHAWPSTGGSTNIDMRSTAVRSSFSGMRCGSHRWGGPRGWCALCLACSRCLSPGLVPADQPRRPARSATLRDPLVAGKRGNGRFRETAGDAERPVGMGKVVAVHPSDGRGSIASSHQSPGAAPSSNCPSRRSGRLAGRFRVSSPFGGESRPPLAALRLQDVAPGGLDRDRAEPKPGSSGENRLQLRRLNSGWRYSWRRLRRGARVRYAGSARHARPRRLAQLPSRREALETSACAGTS